jgi:hypothetical protein
MGIKTILGWILKAPLILLVLATIGVGFYAASGNVSGFTISYNGPILLTGFLITYSIGYYLCKNDKKAITTDSNTYLDTNNSNYDEETQRAIEQYEE